MGTDCQVSFSEHVVGCLAKDFQLELVATGRLKMSPVAASQHF